MPLTVWYPSTRSNAAESDDVLYCPYLIARGNGELAATWFSGHDERLRAHVARFEVGEGSAPPRKMEAPEFQPDSWGLSLRRENSQRRSPAGEYLGITLLKDTGLGVISPIQNEREHRFGFTWWRMIAR